MNKKSFNTIILGAGAPHFGSNPAALIETKTGISILKWVLDAISAHFSEIVFISGYQYTKVKDSIKNLKIIENKEWENTGNVISLFKAEFDLNKPLLVIYNDILFRKNIIDKLLNSNSEITIVCDSTWDKRFNSRSESDMNSCEKVVVNENTALKLGYSIPLNIANSEFVGIALFSKQSVSELKKLQNENKHLFIHSSLSELIEFLRLKGFTINVIDIKGDWAEINESKDIAQFVLGSKSDTLYRLRGIIKNAVIPNQISFTVDEWQKSHKEIKNNVINLFGLHNLAVRSSAINEDSFSSAMAGVYTSVLNVKANHNLESAIQEVINSYESKNKLDKVFVQPMVKDVIISGVAFTKTLNNKSPWYVINYESGGNTDGITSGNSNSHFTYYHKRGTSINAISKDWVKSLLIALIEIEDLLGYDYLDVEFAIDSNGIVFILQVRPITIIEIEDNISDDLIDRAIIEAQSTWDNLKLSNPHLPGNAKPIYGLMPDWNPAEIIGTSPNPLAVSLYSYLILNETWSEQRFQFGYWDVRPQPLLVNFAGRPYVDVRASFASFIPRCINSNIASKLLNFYIEWLIKNPHLHDKIEFDVIPTCFGPNFNFWENRLTIEGKFEKNEIEILKDGLKKITQTAFKRTNDDLLQIENLKIRYDNIIESRINAIEKVRILLDDCKKLGTLPFAHLARSAFVAVTLIKESVAIGILSTQASDSFFSSIRTVSHNLTIDANLVFDNKITWVEFVDKYGHLRPGTYDINSPRYDSDPELYLRPLIKKNNLHLENHEEINFWEKEKKSFLSTLKKNFKDIDEKELELFLRNAIEGREYAKFIFSRNLSKALEIMIEFGQSIGLSRYDLSFVNLDELLSFRDTKYLKNDFLSFLLQNINSRKTFHKVTKMVELPALITNINDLVSFEIGEDIPNFIGSKNIISKIIDLTNLESSQKINVIGMIVLIPQADPGYDWIFGQGVSGLITQYGGANSHMAIRAAEFGIPAAIGIGKKKFEDVSKANMLLLDPSNRNIKILR